MDILDRERPFANKQLSWGAGWVHSGYVAIISCFSLIAGFYGLVIIGVTEDVIPARLIQRYFVRDG